MRKTVTCEDFTKLNKVHSKKTPKSYLIKCSPLQNTTVQKKKYLHQLNNKEVFEQACSTTFNSKILWDSNWQSKNVSSVISPNKSQYGICERKNKLSVTGPYMKMKTESAEIQQDKWIQLTQPSQKGKKLEESYQNCKSTSYKIKKFISEVNPENSFNQKQQIIKKLGGNKSSQLKQPIIFKFYRQLTQQMKQDFQQTSENKLSQSTHKNLHTLKENCGLLRIEKKLNHMNKKKIQINTQENGRSNMSTKVKTETDGPWIILNQISESSCSIKKKNSVETPINRLFEQDKQTMVTKPKFFRHS